MNKICKLIATRRRLLGWSKEILASKSGVSINEITEIEKGADYRETSILRIIDVIMQAMNSKQVISLGRDLDDLNKGIENTEKNWSSKYDQCIACGKTDRPHMARGLCIKCYDKNSALEHTKHRTTRTRGESSSILTREFLEEHYVEKQKSLTDVAKECNCSRQYVHKMMKRYGIPLRDKSSARILALEEHKIAFIRPNDDGSTERVALNKVRINQDFFSNWTDQMAYVLGVLFTDGHLSYGRYNPRQLTPTRKVCLAQKEPELLEKVLALMNCNAKIKYNRERRYSHTVAGETYQFEISNNKFCDDLIKLGFEQRKSLIIKFPEMPQEYIRHFIRGCWDGDGSVYLEQADNRIKASYVSGSQKFIEGMVAALKDAGFPEMRIHIQLRKNPSYYFRFSTMQVPKLFHYLYDDVPKSQYLKRKHDLFEMSEVLINKHGNKYETSHRIAELTKKGDGG